MSKFLDETGLAYFWGKIKDYVSSHGAGLPNGGTTGQYLKKNSSADQDAGWANFPTIPSKVSDLTNDSNFITGMEILSYGNSTWNDFITAYNAKKVVYCRASSNSNPASGSQTRLAFMAYVNNESNPTNVEFQYYRSVNSHSDSQQGDQVYVYKLTSAGTWTVTVRENYTKIVAGTGLSSSYNSGVLTLTNDGPNGVYVGATAPTDPDINVWLDTDEPGQTVVTSVNGMSGPVIVGTYESGTDGIWTYRKYSDGTYHAWHEGGVNLLAGTAWCGGYFHQSGSALTPPSFSTAVTSLSGAPNGALLMAFVGHAPDYSTYWLNGNSQAGSGYQVRIDMYGTW